MKKQERRRADINQPPTKSAKKPAVGFEPTTA